MQFAGFIDEVAAAKPAKWNDSPAAALPADRGRYSHILAPMSPGALDASALRLGLDLADRHQARLTILHVLPPDHATADGGGIELLHRAVRPWTQGPSRPPAIDLQQFRNETLAKALAHSASMNSPSLDIRVELRRGDVAEQICGFVDCAGVDLVILSSPANPWWWPMFPGTTRRIMRRCRAKTILLPRAADARLAPAHDFAFG